MLFVHIWSVKTWCANPQRFSLGTWPDLD